MDSCRQQTVSLKRRLCLGSPQQEVDNNELQRDSKCLIGEKKQTLKKKNQTASCLCFSSNFLLSTSFKFGEKLSVFYNVLVLSQLRPLSSTWLLGWFGLGRRLSGVQRLEEAEEAGGFADAAELDAEGLDLDEKVLHVDDLVPDQRLQEDADEPHQTVLRRYGTSN